MTLFADGRRLGTRILIAALLLPTAYTVFRAATLRVEYYDGYAYLSNARHLGGDRALLFDKLRPPLVSLVQLPVVRAAAAAAAPSPWLIVGPHLVAAGLSLLVALAVFSAFRQGLDLPGALLGTLLFMGTRYFIRYGAHVMTDLPVTGWSAAVLASFLAARRRGSLPLYALCGAALGAAVATKYSAALLAVVLVLIEALSCVRIGRQDGRFKVAVALALRPWAGLVIAALGAALAFVAVVAAVWIPVFGAEALARYREGLEIAGGYTQPIPGETPWEHLPMLLQMISPAAALLAAAGLIVALVRPERRDLPFFVWLVVVAGGIVGVMRHNEARYVLPAVPALLYFAVRAVQSVWGRWVLRGPTRAARAAVAAILIGTVVLSLGAGARQAWADHDGFFRADVQRRAAAVAAAAVRGQGRLLVLGRWHTLSPRDPGPVPQDEFWNTFHYAPHIAEYLLGRKLERLLVANGRLAEVLPRLGDQARDGDAILRLDDLFYISTNYPTGPKPRPLEVWAIHRAELRPDAGTPGRYVSPDGALAVTLSEGRGVGRFHLTPHVTMPEAALFVRSKFDPSRTRLVWHGRLVGGEGLAVADAQRASGVGTVILLRGEVTTVPP